MATRGPIFRFTYTCVSDLPVEEIWPDGDAPKRPTADDVRQIISSYGGGRAILESWCLDEHDGEWSVEEIDPELPTSDAEPDITSAVRNLCEAVEGMAMHGARGKAIKPYLDRARAALARVER